MKDLIQDIIDNEINPLLGQHLGSCELVSVENNDVYLRMNGGCAGCPSSKITLYNYILPIIQQKTNDNISIILVE